jgi:hypothetical protein
VCHDSVANQEAGRASTKHTWYFSACNIFQV